MICLVYMEHRKLLEDPTRRTENLARCMEAKLRLEEAAGDACLVQHYPKVTRQRLAEWGIKALVIGGFSTPWAEYDWTELSELNTIIREAVDDVSPFLPTRRTAMPILGICGGWQLIGRALGAPVGPMGRLGVGEPDPVPESGPGYRKEWGYLPVHVRGHDPLFEGLGTDPVFFEAHYDQVAAVPDGFHILASTAQCAVQAARHRTRLVYGTQFHPENYNEEWTAGRQLLSNFFRLIEGSWAPMT